MPWLTGAPDRHCSGWRGGHFLGLHGRRGKGDGVRVPSRQDTGDLREAGASAPAEACLSEIRLLSNGKPLALQPPRGVSGRIQASSVLEPADSYHPGLLFDGRLDYGWAEGTAGTGAGESLTLTLDEPIEAVGLLLWNGYQRSTDHFRRTRARVGSRCPWMAGRPSRSR